MHLRKSDLIEIAKQKIINQSYQPDNEDNFQLDGDTINQIAEAIADDIFKKLKHDLFNFAEKATDSDAILSLELDNYLIEH